MSRPSRNRARSQPSLPTSNPTPSLRSKATKTMKKLFATRRSSQPALADHRKSISSSITTPDSPTDVPRPSTDAKKRSSILHNMPEKTYVDIKGHNLDSDDPRTGVIPLTLTPASPQTDDMESPESRSLTVALSAVDGSVPTSPPRLPTNMLQTPNTDESLKPPLPLSINNNNSPGADSGYGTGGTSPSHSIPERSSPHLESTRQPTPSASLSAPVSTFTLTASPEAIVTSLPSDPEASRITSQDDARTRTIPSYAGTSSSSTSASSRSTLPTPSATPRLGLTKPSPAGKTHLRLRLDSLSQPFPPLPVPTSPHAVSASYYIPPITPNPPGGWHYKSSSEPGSSLTPRLSGSPHGGFTSPSGNAMKMTPSLTTRPSLLPLRLPTLRTPSLGPERTLDQSDIVPPSPARLPRESRPSVPALRRDGSFYYTVAPSDHSPGEGEDQEQSESDSDDSDYEGDMRPPSDDEPEQVSRQLMSPTLSGMARSIGSGFKAIVGMSPTISSSSTSGPSTPLSPSTSISPSPRTPSSLSTPNTANRMSLAASGAPHESLTTVEDIGEVEDGQLADTIGLVVGSMATRTRRAGSLTSQTTAYAQPRPRQQSSHQEDGSAINRETIYETPLPTPSATSDGFRVSVYYDAEGDSDDEGLSQGGASAFTTTTTTSASELTPRITAVEVPWVSPTPSAPDTPTDTIRTPTGGTTPKTKRRPTLEGMFLETGVPGAPQLMKQDFSALGLDFTESESAKATPTGPSTIHRSAEFTASPSRRATNASWDYFSSKTIVPMDSGPSSPADRRNGMSPRTPLALLKTPKTPGGRPVMYSQTSHSMIDFGSMRMADEEVVVVDVKDKGKGREGQVVEHGKEEEVVIDTTRSPPPPFATSTLSRRMSLPDLSRYIALPPSYASVIAPRDDEGKETLPPYKCAIHFEASMPRKMEFVQPGVLAKDRGWKRVWVVLSGTGLWIYKQDPRRWALKNQASAAGGKIHHPGGKKLDGVVDVDDLLIGTPNVHVPIEVLRGRSGKQKGGGGVPLKKTSSRGSNGSSGANTPTGNTRPSSESSRTNSRLSLDGAVGSGLSVVNGLALGAFTRSSGSSSSNGASSSSFNLTTPTSSTPNDTSMDSSSSYEKLPHNPSVVKAPPKHIHSHASSSGGSQLLAQFQNNTVLRSYTLQGGETGLASDYHKRRNVIRVRAEGEQFLLQADDMGMTVDWIEAFQAAANVSLDLDVRPMPKMPALPRRRRRRRVPVPGAEGNEPVPPPPEPTPTSENTSRSSNRFSFSRRHE